MTTQLLKHFAATAILAAGTCAALSAQRIQTANVPVAFQVGSHHMPAGKYVISENSTTFFLRNAANGSTIAIGMPIPLDKAPGTGPHLTFKTYGGDRWLLAEIWSLQSARTQGRFLNKQQREADQLSGPSNVLMVPLRALR
jgi:hypothetical protein